jgi:hypothetical protein
VINIVLGLDWPATVDWRHVATGLDKWPGKGWELSQIPNGNVDESVNATSRVGMEWRPNEAIRPMDLDMPPRIETRLDWMDEEIWMEQDQTG